MSSYLIIPGWAGSGPDHWQSHWEGELVGAARVEMPDWHVPRRADWVEALDRAVQAQPAPPILIAHSLGCIAVAHWASRSTHRVRAALLVAPADVDRASSPPVLRGFAPVPRGRLPFPSRVVASDDDPFVTLPRGRQMSLEWGSDLSVLDGAGHINPDSGHGPWPAGLALLRRLEQEAADAEVRALAAPPCDRGPA